MDFELTALPGKFAKIQINGQTRHPRRRLVTVLPYMYPS